jgi:hypothetical protein
MPAPQHVAYLSRMDAVIQLSDVTKRYDSGARPALDRVGRRVAPRGDRIGRAAHATPAAARDDLPRLNKTGVTR